MRQPDSVRFIDYRETLLEAGVYRVHVTQRADVTDVNKVKTRHDLGDAELAFSVISPRFALGSDNVADVFPPVGARGAFAGVLPHVIMNTDTLPWQRSAALAWASTPQPPWMALLLFTTPEWETVTVDSGGAGVTVGTLNSTDPLHPALPSERQQHAEDPVSVIDVPAALATALCPELGDLDLLTHVREATWGSDVRAQSVVVCNRPIDPGDKEEGFVVCLVSLEGRWRGSEEPTALLPKGDAAKVRFVVLHRWTFRSLANQPELHTMIRGMTGADVLDEDLSTPTSVDLSLRLPTPDGLSEGVQARTRAGFVPITHYLRDGSRSGAWYRGPFAPHDAPLPRPDSVVHVRDADELCSFDESLGMFDVSYATAWQLGRTMALAERESAMRLVRLKHRLRRAAQVGADAASHPMLSAHSDPAEPATELRLSASKDPDIRWLLDESLFARLGRLEGLPFRTLIADERLLPDGREAGSLEAGLGSLRAFAVDPWWGMALWDGAFSVGRVTEGDALADLQVQQELALSGLPRTFGVILRGAGLRSWPNLVVDAWVPIGNGAGAFEDRHVALSSVRVDSLSDDVRVFWFSLADRPPGVGDDARPVAFDVHPPLQTLHFGLDRTPHGDWRRLMRHPVTGLVLQENGDEVSVDIPMRQKEGDPAVMRVDALREALERHLDDPLSAHTMALTLIDPADKVRVFLAEVS